MGKRGEDETRTGKACAAKDPELTDAERQLRDSRWRRRRDRQRDRQRDRLGNNASGQGHRSAQDDHVVRDAGQANGVDRGRGRRVRKEPRRIGGRGTGRRHCDHRQAEPRQDVHQEEDPGPDLDAASAQLPMRPGTHHIVVAGVADVAAAELLLLIRTILLARDFGRRRSRRRRQPPDQPSPARRACPSPHHPGQDARSVGKGRKFAALAVHKGFGRIVGAQADHAPRPIPLPTSHPLVPLPIQSTRSLTHIV